MKKTYFVVAGILVISVLAFFVFNTKEVSGMEAVYYKSISCGCCDVHSKYLSSKGFDIKINNLKDVSEIKENFNIPLGLQSCHTAVIEGYFVEGHIPMEAISKLLDEKPDIKGIAMPGMPEGSPGMPGIKRGDFVIYSVNHDGSYDEWMRI
ncbi:hypothetical protein COU59_02855 [Candidatus Pacearchaeota archaeon CG10_big_fil_rev_8_21_14_0_10_34_12]|nr:MAG: hypothetical protein COU59_02855 [Candidatus Pacearchaeota archaeon CG10_big_fil_rev_8_21_14_0_10_34_12]